MSQKQKYFVIFYCIKFLFLVFGFYYFSIAFNGIVSPEGGIYSAFLDNHLNFINWIRESNMYVSNGMANALGTRSYISGPQMINIGKDIEVEIWLPCLGLGIMSFWAAFVIVNEGTLKRKVKWGIAGIFAIWSINSCRIALLLISLDRSWRELRYVDHHDLFNIVAYTFIFIMMYFYTRKPIPSIITLNQSPTYKKSFTNI